MIIYRFKDTNYLENMGLLSNLFNLGKKDNSTTAKPLGVPPINSIGPLSNAQKEFLTKIPKQPVNSYMDKVWSPVIGPVEKSISRFIEEGLIREATIPEKFDVKFKVADLKLLFNTYNVKAKGKKSEMINTLLSVMPQDEASALVTDLKLYSPTQSGQDIIEPYQEQKKQQRLTMEADALSFLVKGDVLQAGTVIAQYESVQVFPRGVGVNWGKGLPSPSHDEAKYLLKASYNDLALDESKRYEIAARLALSSMLGESVSSAGKRLLEVTHEQFPCAALIKFLRDNPCGSYASSKDPDNPSDLAELYAHTKRFQATSHIQLKQLKSDRSIGKGIEILNNKTDKCPLCNVNKLQYSWSEINELPKLPRHWGCRCDYVIWL